MMTSMRILLDLDEEGCFWWLDYTTYNSLVVIYTYVS